MKIGITLPAMIPGTPADTILEWARRADSGPFSSVAIGERLLWPGHDLMVTLSAAAAVTQRVKLVATIVVLPLHSAVVVAKQAATLDVLSRGRLTLGVGIGGRDDDFRAVGVPFTQRHQRMEEQVAQMRRIWRGAPPEPGLSPVGPLPVQAGGPEILVGSVFPRALRRVARWADGLSGWSFEPNAEVLASSYQILRDSWREAGRAGQPRCVAGFWYALGPHARTLVDDFVTRYLAERGETLAARIARGVRTTSAAALKDALAAMADIGTDETILVPVSADVAQLEQLADLIA